MPVGRAAIFAAELVMTMIFPGMDPYLEHHELWESVHAFLIGALADLGIGAGRREGLTGVWVGARKIASLGVAVRRWVTWHGFALNVGPDLSGFVPITPCGIEGVQMTSVAREGGPGTLMDVLPCVRARFVATFGYRSWRPLEVEPVGGESRP